MKPIKQKRCRWSKSGYAYEIKKKGTDRELKMKRENVSKGKKQSYVQKLHHHVTQRLDESLPLQTEEWTKVEQTLMRMTEFAPHSLIEELVGAIASYADDQARRGYLLGQDDLTQEIKQLVA